MATTKNKTLYRSEKNKMVGGVAGGIADYFNIDPVIVRLIFILMVIYGGSGVLIYIILWLVIPSQSDIKSPTEVNVKKGAKEIQNKAEKFAHSISDGGSNRVYLGIFILAIGILFLFNNFGVFSFFNIFKLWPILIVGVGISLLIKSDEK